ncbi:MAG: acetyl-CoA carboxylase carboxyl transferase subunit beta, partial [Alphaproteobacteria bacterium]|nr:acetyl-CoA carboxylase carboxyl transferase subunit beta [Alphaproteobacteria bacterium]
MSWLSNFVRPKIQALVRRRETPENLWLNCPECSQLIHHLDLKANLHVCQHCGHHMRIGPAERFESLFDPASYERIVIPEVISDPLKFRDEKRYGERLRDARQKTGEDEAIAVAHGRMGGMPTVVACQNFAFMGGSMGLAVGEALLAGAQLAVL